MECGNSEGINGVEICTGIERNIEMTFGLSRSLHNKKDALT
jgi:hypothetical protein